MVTLYVNSFGSRIAEHTTTEHEITLEPGPHREACPRGIGEEEKEFVCLRMKLWFNGRAVDWPTHKTWGSKPNTKKERKGGKERKKRLKKRRERGGREGEREGPYVF